MISSKSNQLEFYTHVGTSRGKTRRSGWAVGARSSMSIKINIDDKIERMIRCRTSRRLLAACGGELGGQLGEDVGNVVPGVAVQTLLESLLVEVVADETDGAAQNEEAVKSTNINVLLALLRREGSAVTEEIHKHDTDRAVNVQDQVGLLGGCHLLNFKGEVEQRSGGEVLLGVLLDDLNTEIGVVQGLDSVTDAEDQLVLGTHAGDELLGAEARVEGSGELLCSTVECTTETVTNGQETGAEGRDQILSSTGSDDRVVGTRHGRAVVSNNHETHLNELAGVCGEATAEPEEGEHTTDADVLLEDSGDGHAGIEQLLASLIRDGGNERGRLADQTKLLGPLEVDGDLGGLRFGLALDDALSNEVLEHGTDGRVELVEVGRHVGTGILESLVLGNRGLGLAMGQRASVAELDL
eukprot:Colp12_sorted_trinity150504_noHs@35